MEFYTELLSSLTSQELSQAVREVSWCAAWHAANSRSMLWRDAKKDERSEGLEEMMN